MTLYDYLERVGMTGIPATAKQIAMPSEPWAHQFGDLKHLLQHTRCGIWNDAGSGKTMPMQASALLWALLGNKVVAVMPPTLIGQWIDELREKYAGCDDHISIGVFAGTKAKRDRMLDGWKQDGFPDLIVMSYELFRNMHPIKAKSPGIGKGPAIKPLRHHPLKEAGYNVLIFDEAHKLKNTASTVHKVLWRWIGTDEDNYCVQLFTGSPIPNTIEDAYGLIRLIDPRIYGTKRNFEQRHCVFNRDSDFREVIGYKNVDVLYENLYRRGRRVTKQEAVKSLPDMIPIECPVSLGAKHKALYKQVVTERILEIGDRVIDATHSSKFRQLALQIVSNPEMFCDEKVDNTLDNWLDETLETINPTENKVIIFCYFKQTVERLREKYAHLNPAVIYGATKDSNAEREKFTEDDSCRVIILNMDSGGVGLNLQISHYVIFFEPPITPMQAQQGIARAHRGGQRHAVRVYVPRVRGTIASQRLSKLLSKERQNNEVIRDKHKLLHELLGKNTK